MKASRTVSPASSSIDDISGPWKVAVVFSVVTVLLLLVYVPVIHTDFLYRDDNVYLTLPTGWNMTRVTFAQARPGLGLVIDCLNTSVVAGAGAKHLFTILGLGLLATSLFVWLCRNRIRPLIALLLSVSVCCLPAFQATIPYLSVAGAIYAAFASSLAIHLQFRSTTRQRFCRDLLSGLLVFGALSVYQPAAMFGWALIIVPLYQTSHGDWPLFRKRLVRYATVFGCSLAGYAVTYKTAIDSAGMALSGRAEILSLSDFPAKLIWLYTTLIPLVVQSVFAPLLPFRSTPCIPWAIVAVLAAIGGLIRETCCRDLITCTARLGERIGLLAFLMAMSYLPFLLLSENGQEPIYGTGLYTAIFLAATLGLKHLASTRAIRPSCRISLTRKFESVLCAAVLCCFALSASRTVYQEIVLPCHSRYRTVYDAVAASHLDTIDTIYVIPDDRFLGAYAEGLVRGVLNETQAIARRPSVASASRSAPAALHIQEKTAKERYGEEFSLYYRFDAVNRVYLLKEDLMPDQRQSANRLFRDFLAAVEGQSGVLIIDLARNPALSHSSQIGRLAAEQKGARAKP